MSKQGGEVPEEAVEALWLAIPAQEAITLDEAERFLQAALPALEQHFRRKLLDGLSKDRNLSEALYQLVRQDAADEARKELARALLSDEAVEAAKAQWRSEAVGTVFTTPPVEQRFRRAIEAALNSTTKGDTDHE